MWPDITKYRHIGNPLCDFFLAKIDKKFGALLCDLKVCINGSFNNLNKILILSYVLRSL